MSVSESKRLKYCAYLLRGAKIIILDEPTAVLTVQETEKIIRSAQKDEK